MLDFGIGVYILLNLAFIISEHYFISLFPDFKLDKTIFYCITGVNYLMLSLVYAVIGVIILRRLKTNFNPFYL